MVKSVSTACYAKPTNRDTHDGLSPRLLPKQGSLLTDNELKLWLKYIEHQVGFILPSSQTNWVKYTLERYLQHYQLDTTALLAKLTQDTELYHQLFDDILIPRTQFFRHLPTFEFIESYARYYTHRHPNVQSESNQPLSPLTVWSVGCSSGQEAVSVVLSLAKTLGLKTAFRVFGSDFHQQSLAVAKLGQYEASQLAYIPAPYQPYMEQKTVTAATASHVLSKKVISLPSELAERLTFFGQNLMQPMVDLPVALGSCQLILCNNVLIYFRQFDQRDIINHLIPYLATDGVLILGAGELPHLNNPQLKRLPYSQMNGFCNINAPIWLEQLYLTD